MDKRRRRKRSIASKIIITVACTILAMAVIVTAVGAGVFISTKGKVVNGVHFEDIDVAGQTKEELVGTLEKFQNTFTDKVINLKSDKAETKLDVSSIDFHIDSQKLIEDLYSYGREGNILNQLFTRISLKFNNVSVEVEYSLDEKLLSAKLDELSQLSGGGVVENKVAVLEEKNEEGKTKYYLTITPGKDGYKVENDSAMPLIFDAILKRAAFVKLPLTTTLPTKLDVNKICEQYKKDAVDAEFTIIGGKASFEMDENGYRFDKDRVIVALENLDRYGKEIKVEAIEIAPTITFADLEASLFVDTLSSFSSKYNEGLADRSSNVKIATKNVNGTIVFPGEEFSYNKAVGPRNSKTGFKNAQIYENGKVVDGMGGGICQVSSTIYPAALYADFEIVERRNHSLPVRYVPLGLDATVVWGQIDFRFKNNTDYPIKINASAENGTINISIVGTNTSKGKTVKLEEKVIGNSEPPVEKINDPTLPKGTTKIKSNGTRGSIVETYKYIYQDGELVSKKMIHTSRYAGNAKEILVGTGAAAPSASPSAKPKVPAASSKPSESPASPAD